MMGPTVNLISGTYHACERREYTFMVLREYTIIFCGQHSYTHKLANGDLTHHGGLKVRFFFFFGSFLSLIDTLLLIWRESVCD